MPITVEEAMERIDEILAPDMGGAKPRGYRLMNDPEHGRGIHFWDTRSYKAAKGKEKEVMAVVNEYID